MKKEIILSALFLLCATQAMSGSVELPLERLALPVVQGNHLVCVWDDAGQTWLQGFESYSHAGTYEFQLPSWNKWYWVGLWDETQGEYVFGKWIGHFPTE